MTIKRPNLGRKVIPAAIHPFDKTYTTIVLKKNNNSYYKLIKKILFKLLE